MISAATQTLANFIAQGGSSPLIKKEHISFEHPQIKPLVQPNLNLYCYDLQPSNRKPYRFNSHTEIIAYDSYTLAQPLSTLCQWFELTFLISACDHTALGEQRILSDVLQLLASYSCLPESCLATPFKGYQMPIRVSVATANDPIQLWQAFQAPLKCALHVTLTVPIFQQVSSSLPAPLESHLVLSATL